MPTVDLNCDLGEGFDDAPLFRLVTSASVACGGHAGDAATMAEACRRAAANGVTIGAHPSYEDREGFGRRNQEVEPERLRFQVVAQVAALRVAADAAGVPVRYLKPHGALYNRIAGDPVQAGAVARAAQDAGLPLLGPPGSAIERAAEERAVPFFREAFADRGYTPDGRLAPRGAPGALLTDPAEIAARALGMVLAGAVTATDGTEVRLAFDSLCLHGDTPGAAEAARAVRARLESGGVTVRPFR